MWPIRSLVVPLSAIAVTIALPEVVGFIIVSQSTSELMEYRLDPTAVILNSKDPPSPESSTVVGVTEKFGEFL